MSESFSTTSFVLELVMQPGAGLGQVGQGVAWRGVAWWSGVGRARPVSSGIARFWHLPSEEAAARRGSGAKRTLSANEILEV